MKNDAERLALSLAANFASAFIVIGGEIYKRNKAGKRQGKPLANGELLGALSGLNVEYRNSPVPLQMETLEILRDSSGGSSEETDAADIDEVDPWLVPLLQAFRWFSDGRTIHGFFWPQYARSVADGGDGSDAKRELQIIIDVDSKGIPTALQAHGKIWAAYEDAYRYACAQPAIKVTPKSVRDGVKYYHSFRNYLALMATPWMSDIRFAIDTMPETLSNDPEQWAFWHFSEGDMPSEPSPTPTWDRWQLKIVGGEPARKVFRAWIAGVFDASNNGRQLLWIEDNGGGGKGTIARTLENFIGQSGYGALGKGTFESEFGMESVFGKRLLIHPDNANSRLLSTSLVHQITGGDSVLVNRKNEKMFTARMRAKMLIMANCPPDVDMYNFHEASRLLHLRLDPNAEGADKSHLRVDSEGKAILVGDSDFEARLLEEFPHFLVKCVEAYDELCPTGSNIVPPNSVIQAMHSSCVSSEQISFDEFFSENFKSEPGKYMNAREVQEIFEVVGKFSGKGLSFHSFRKYLSSKGIRMTTRDRRHVYIHLTNKV